MYFNLNVFCNQILWLCAVGAWRLNEARVAAGNVDVERFITRPSGLGDHAAARLTFRLRRYDHVNDTLAILLCFGYQSASTSSWLSLLISHLMLGHQHITITIFCSQFHFFLADAVYVRHHPMVFMFQITDFRQ
jgi:hypothetical protein